MTRSSGIRDHLCYEFSFLHIPSKTRCDQHAFCMLLPLPKRLFSICRRHVFHTCPFLTFSLLFTCPLPYVYHTLMSADSSWARYTTNFLTLHSANPVVLIDSHRGSFPWTIGLWLRPKASIFRVTFILQSRSSPTHFVFAASPYLHSANNVATASC